MAQGKRPSVAHLWVPPCTRQRPPGGRWSKPAPEAEEPEKKTEKKTEEKKDPDSEEDLLEPEAKEPKEPAKKTDENTEEEKDPDSEEDRPLAQC